MKKIFALLCTSSMLLPTAVMAKEAHNHQHTVADSVIAEQRATLAEHSKSKGVGPQSPRDIDNIEGTNKRIFGYAPAPQLMNLCNIHFHKNAEHKGGEFTRYAGNGDGHGYQSGFRYSGELSAAELTPLDKKVGESKHGSLYPGDTIEVHYVYSSAQVTPGHSLGACLDDETKNPQLRVESLVMVLVNDNNAASFVSLAEHKVKDGYHQAINIPSNSGNPIQYLGSTTGPGYNEKASPFQVTWNVRPKVLKVDIHSLDKWLAGNDFKEDHAHGVRNLVINPSLLSSL